MKKEKSREHKLKQIRAPLQDDDELFAKEHHVVCVSVCAQEFNRTRATFKHASSLLCFSLVHKVECVYV